MNEGSKRVTVGSVLCDARASVWEIASGYVVRCTCGGTIGVDFPSPFDLEPEAILAAHAHVKEHVKDGLSEAEVVLGLAELMKVEP